MNDFGTEIAIIAIILISFLISRSFSEKYRRIKFGNTLKPCSIVRTCTVDEKSDSPVSSSVNEFKGSHSANLPRRTSPRFIAEIDEMVDGLRQEPDALIRKIIELCNKNYDAASAIFFKSRQLNILSKENVCADFFLTLCSSCIRVGSPHFIFKYFEEMDQMHVRRDLDFYHSIVKILSFKKFFKIALSISDQYLKVGMQDSECHTRHSINSLLLFASIECKEFWRSSKLFKQIVRTGIPPSESDIAHQCQSILHREDWKMAIAFICLNEVPLKLQDVLLNGIFAAKSATLVRLLIGSIQTANLANRLLKHKALGHHCKELISEIFGKNLLNEKTIEILLKHTNLISLIDDSHLFSSLKVYPWNLIELLNVLLEKGIPIELQFLQKASPNLQTFTLLFAGSANGLEIFHMLQESNVVVDIEFMNKVCLPAMNRWQEIKQVIDELKIVLPNHDSFTILIAKILEEGKFDVCWDLIVNDMVAKFGIVPQIDLYLRIIAAGILRGQYAYVNLFFQGMCDQHTLSLSWGTSGECNRITGNDIENLLHASLVDEECFFLIVELCLLNKLSLSNQFTTMIKSVYNKDRLRSILEKYKYKVPIKALQH